MFRIFEREVQNEIPSHYFERRNPRGRRAISDLEQKWLVRELYNLDMGNNNSAVPQWITDRVAAETIANLQAQYDRQRNSSGQLQVSQNGPKFWDDLCTWLEINTTALLKIGLRASVGRGEERDQKTARIDIDRAETLFPRPYHITLFYRPKDDCIKSYSVDGTSSILRFGIQANDDLGLVVEEFTFPLDAQFAAERIVQNLVDRFKPWVSKSF